MEMFLGHVSFRVSKVRSCLSLQEKISAPKNLRRDECVLVSLCFYLWISSLLRRYLEFVDSNCYLSIKLIAIQIEKEKQFK